MLAELTSATQKFAKTTKIQAPNKFNQEGSQIKTEKAIKQK